ncbi:winged helix-turn-helix domain-containing protein [Marinactinospora rubrisoli]|uniref:Winged helix-turn-helix domain-containing protein n=1 Tax=Marinactinospora rubrisoli TaxID=2715399 RepID=A0ABW2KKH9_9ACTN
MTHTQAAHGHPPSGGAAPTTSRLAASPLALEHDESTRLLGVLPLAERGKVMVIVGHIRDASGAMTEPCAADGSDALVIDRATRRVLADRTPVRLSYQEFELLAHLASSPGRVFSRSELLDRVWRSDTHAGTRTVDVHIHRLRRKLGELGHRLATVRRVGYAYQPERRAVERPEPSTPIAAGRSVSAAKGSETASATRNTQRPAAERPQPPAPIAAGRSVSAAKGSETASPTRNTQRPAAERPQPPTPIPTAHPAPTGQESETADPTRSTRRDVAPRRYCPPFR